MLEEYGKKRDFARSPEPGPERQGVDEGPLTFVIQKHAARRLHYDFRLELDGVLKSWSVPKGPSLNPKEKRLAVLVEDHPLDYASFEGVIPRGQYGAGQVIVWDSGTYSPDEDGRLSFHDRGEAGERLRRALAAGKLSVSLRGHKLRGSWALVKTKTDWLLIKHQDEFADPARDIRDDDRSVHSGLSIDDLKAGHLPRGQGLGAAELPGARQTPFPPPSIPCWPPLRTVPFPGTTGCLSPSWMASAPLLSSARGAFPYEPSWQRCDLLVSLRRRRPGRPTGEGARPRWRDRGPDQQGVPSFHLLQQRLNLSREADIRQAEAAIPVQFFAFDILHLNGQDLRALPLERRKELLRRALLPSGLAQRRNSAYESGKRSRSWLKIKAVQGEEFVVGGFTRGEGHRADTFGALLLGYFRGDKLVFVGHVGSGFTDAAVASIRSRLDQIRSDECPFAEPPSLNAPATWVTPELVAEVKFSQWTPDRRLRAPVFLRLREDKDPRLIVRPREPRAAPPKPSPHSRPSSPYHQDDVAGLLEELQIAKQQFTVTVQGHKISLTNLDKQFWPPLGEMRPLTKRDLLVYLAKVSPYLLPHMRDRPLTRYPDGVQGEFFYQKHWEQPQPEFVETVRLYSSHNEGDVEYILVNNLPTLLWLGQLADLELHTWYSRTSPEPDGHHLSTEFSGSRESIEASALNYPDFIVFDLDPYIYSGREGKGDESELNRKAFAKTAEIALHLKELLGTLSLSSFVKTSGRTGLHVYVPILRQFDYDAVRSASETIGRFLLEMS